MKLNQIKFVIVAIVTNLGILTNLNPARSANIALENPGFEAPKQTNEPVPGAGFFDFTTPPGWSLDDPNNLIPDNATLGTAFTGGWQPSDSFFPNIPEGEQIGSIFLVPPGLGEVGLVQSSGILIEPETEYTLSVAVLNTPSVEGSEFFAGFPGYRLELLAGNTVISVDNNSVAIAEGEFERVSISYNSLNDSNYLGAELGIRLVNLNLNNNSGLDNGNGTEVNFDDVRLDATSIDRNTTVPESHSIFGLFLIGSLLLRNLKN
jgi:hapalindole H/12-epi-hapalindole U/12-epi-fischerindole U synthase